MALRTSLSPVSLILAVGLVAGLVVGLTIAGPAAARSIALDNKQKVMLGQLADYLNGISTLKARFTQRTSKGGYGEGDMWVWRPGRFRFEYDPPNPFLLVADSKMIGYYDFEQKESSFIPLAASPAAFFLRKRVTFEDREITITGFKEGNNSVEVSVVQTGEADEGSLTLNFSKKPLTLSGWTIVDPEGLVTTVAIIKPTFGVNVNKDMFLAKEIQWMAPKLGMKPSGANRSQKAGQGVKTYGSDR